jgi:hypothetical protein
MQGEFALYGVMVLHIPNGSAVNGNVKEYSVWRLMTTLKALGYDIGIEVQRLQHGNGHISLRANAEGGQAVLLA